MGVTYFKRYRMEIELSRIMPEVFALPKDYTLVPWRGNLVEAHAEAKYESFRNELDANVFPCLGDREGCRRLMREISQRSNFVSQSTWLLRHRSPLENTPQNIGTVQGLRDESGMGAIQNLGVTEAHRGRRLGTRLLLEALAGFRLAGLERAYLEVTAQNVGAVRLYERLGFTRVKTVFKVAQVAFA